MFSIAHAFVTRDDFADWLSANLYLAADTNYDYWLKQMEQAAKELASNGGQLIKINVKPAEFAAWCRSKGKKASPRTCSEYAALLSSADLRRWVSSSSTMDCCNNRAERMNAASWGSCFGRPAL